MFNPLPQRLNSYYRVEFVSSLTSHIFKKAITYVGGYWSLKSNSVTRDGWRCSQYRAYIRAEVWGDDSNGGLFNSNNKLVRIVSPSPMKENQSTKTSFAPGTAIRNDR